MAHKATKRKSISAMHGQPTSRTFMASKNCRKPYHNDWSKHLRRQVNKSTATRIDASTRMPIAQADVMEHGWPQKTTRTALHLPRGSPCTTVKHEFANLFLWLDFLVKACAATPCTWARADRALCTTLTASDPHARIAREAATPTVAACRRVATLIRANFCFLRRLPSSGPQRWQNLHEASLVQRFL